MPFQYRLDGEAYGIGVMQDRSVVIGEVYIIGFNVQAAVSRKVERVPDRSIVFRILPVQKIVRLRFRQDGHFMPMHEQDRQPAVGWRRARPEDSIVGKPDLDADLCSHRRADRQYKQHAGNVPSLPRGECRKAIRYRRRDPEHRPASSE